MQQDQLDPERQLNRADSEKHSDLRPALQQQDLEQLKHKHQHSQQQAFRFILTQLLATLVLFAVLLLFSKLHLFDPVVMYVVAYSSLIGGLIATLANAWFAIKVFLVKPTVTAEAMLTTFYVGEIYKFIFTGAMFVIVFVLIKPVSIVALLLTYLFIHITPAVQNVLTKD